MKNSRITGSLLSLALLAPLQSNAQEINPTFFYLVKGQPIQRSISLGDPTNWSMNIQGREGSSAGKKITIAPVAFKAKDDAIQLTWAPKISGQGNFGLYGNPIDLSAFKDKAVLSIDMRVDVKPSKTVNIGLDCGYPCRADLPINKLLKGMPKGEWFNLPIPLNCFKGDKFDLSKIAGAFTIATDGKFTVSIANVHLEKLADGETGCAEPTKNNRTKSSE